MATFTNMVIDSELDATILMEFARSRHLPPPPRGLRLSEKNAMVQSGSVYVWNEADHFKRWNDGWQWMDKSQYDHMLIYTEGSFRKIVVRRHPPDSQVIYHLVAYRDVGGTIPLSRPSLVYPDFAQVASQYRRLQVRPRVDLQPEETPNQQYAQRPVAEVNHSPRYSYSASPLSQENVQGAGSIPFQRSYRQSYYPAESRSNYHYPLQPHDYFSPQEQGSIHPPVPSASQGLTIEDQSSQEDSLDPAYVDESRHNCHQWESGWPKRDPEDARLIRLLDRVSAKGPG